MPVKKTATTPRSRLRSKPDSTTSKTTNSLISAMTTNDTVTENMMLTHSTSSDSLLDLFFTIGAMRKEKEDRIIAKFSAAFSSEPTLALKILFWARDIRGGAGERRVFRVLTKWLAENFKGSLIKNLKYVSKFGRWDDLLFVHENTTDPKIKKTIEDLIKKHLDKGNYIKNTLSKIETMSEEECRQIYLSLDNE